ncbi:MAG: Hint domain-containing protein [Pseudomonadota bacterium]|nr:Hint domain-containing protein [Pseudomonadota bacterium]
MTNQTYTQPILLRGDMIASLSGQPTQQANPGDADHGMVMQDVTALGTSSDLYRFVWVQNTNGYTADQFQNGQGWQLQSYDRSADPDGAPKVGDDGWSVVPGYESMVPKNDLVAGLGAGDDYVVLQDMGGSNRFLLYDLDGELSQTPTTMTYAASTEQGDTDVGNNNGELNFDDSYAAVTCFTPGTLIDTPDGARPVEDLAPGDLVVTGDGTARPIRWVGRRDLSDGFMATRPNLRPIRIRAGALGHGMPARDLIVSPQHRVLIRSDIAERMTGSRQVLIAAARLTHMPGINRLNPRYGVTYIHIMFDRHEVVWSNGAATESFYPGPAALGGVEAACRDELFTLFPALAAPLPGSTVPPAFPIISDDRARQLTHRHRKNAKVLFAD